MKIIRYYICACFFSISCTAGFAAKPLPYEHIAGAEWIGIAMKYEECLQSKSESLDDEISDAGSIGSQV